MALDPRGGLNSYWLISLLEDMSQLQIGYDTDVDDINQDLVLQYLKEGFQTIVDADTRWPWFEASYSATIDTTTNDGSGVITGNQSVFVLYAAYAPSPYVTIGSIVNLFEIAYSFVNLSIIFNLQAKGSSKLIIVYCYIPVVMLCQYFFRHIESKPSP